MGLKRRHIRSFLTYCFFIALERRAVPVLGFVRLFLLSHQSRHREATFVDVSLLLATSSADGESSSSSSRRPSNSKDQTELYSFEPFESSMMYDEGRPRRLHSDHHHYQQQEHQQQRIVQHSRQNDWGVDHHIPPPVVFPDTIDSLTDAAMDAIAGTLYEKTCLDPNIVQNALQGDYTHGRRPVRNVRDAGRLGIEIDGAEYLFSLAGRGKRSAIRRVALQLAEKLSRAPWSGYEDSGVVNDDDSRVASRKHDPAPTKSTARRPVVLYFNHIKQAMAACYELLLLKRQAIEKGDELAYSDVTIMTLNEDSTIPTEMLQSGNQQTTGSTTIKRKALKCNVDPTRGLLLVVQPTDYNDEYQPPGPAVCSISAFQKLAAHASVAEIPIVCLSPRFLAHPSSASYYAWDQSGYQQASAYGGVEPPLGPTPWILRDFSPPVFCWIANAMTLRNARTMASGATASSLHFYDQVTRDDCWYGRLSLFQSVMHKGHAWHLFASKECSRQRRSKSIGAGGASIDYQYLASTKNASGRPTREVMKRLFGEFAQYS